MRSLLCVFAVAVAATLVAIPIAAAQEDPAAPLQPQPLYFQNIHITSFRAPSAGYSPKERVAGALQRLEALRGAQLAAPIESVPNERGVAIYVGPVFAFQVLRDDLDLRLGRSPEEMADSAQSRLARALARRAAQFAPSALAVSAVLALVGTAVVALLLWALVRGHNALGAFAAERARRRLAAGVTHVSGVLAVLGTAVRGVVGIAAIAVGFALLSWWAIFVFQRFPGTQAWARAARSFELEVVGRFTSGFFDALPGIFTAILIFAVAHLLARLVKELLTGCERGYVHVPGIHPETASATKRILIALVWVFALVVAYPFLPGSESDAFKGVSVFLGILFTLGSAGFVGHLMSGLVLVYSRALRQGDYVRIGEVQGVVMEVGALSTKLRLPMRQLEITVPNTVLASSTVHNFTRLAGDEGPALTTSVTIGYDAPWRVVHEILLEAARRTAGVRKQPSPVVYQTSLDSFYVVYELIVRLEKAETRPVTLDLLHRNIQDAFNERGIQIMTPHFESQPEHAVVVPKSKWSAAPFDPPAREKSD